MGSPISFWATMGQVFAATMVLDYYAGPRPRVRVRGAPPGHARARRSCAASRWASSARIVPWNVPLFVTMLKLGPALASGSTVVLKPAPETPLDAYLLAEVVQEAGLPGGRRSTSCRPAARSASTSSRHPDVDKISFTGSTVAGRKIAAHLRRAAEALHARARRQVGGDHPRRRRPRVDTIAGPDAQRDHEQRPGVRRADPHPRVARRATTRSSTRWPTPSAATKVGDPLDPATAVGPLFASRQRDRVEGYIAKGKEEGARARHRRRPSGRLRQGLVRRADALRRRRQHDDDRAGGDLRPGPRRVIPYDDVDDARRASPTTPTTASPVRCGPSDPQAGVDVARRVRTGTYGVNGMGMDFAVALRRLQGVGPRPRARARGPRGVPRAEDHRPAAGLRTCLSAHARAAGRRRRRRARRRADARGRRPHTRPHR